MTEGVNVFDSETALPDDRITAQEKTLLGFEERYSRIFRQLRLTFDPEALQKWSKKYHGEQAKLWQYAAEQYPVAIFHGDVGTGKTANAEACANRLVRETKATDSILYKLSNRVRGSGRVGELGTLLSHALSQVRKSIGKNRRAILIVDEGDSIGASRGQQHSHHEDKVAVNTLIQGIDEYRKAGGRILVFLCTNRYSVLDAALIRRAAIVEEFRRPTDDERLALFQMDLKGPDFGEGDFRKLVKLTAAAAERPCWTYSDIRTRLYPAAIALAFPDEALTMAHFERATEKLAPSPVVEGL
jgi:SpoVK/Ycf46/Vps4 family AAA+-type ATPase